MSVSIIDYKKLFDLVIQELEYYHEELIDYDEHVMEVVRQNNKKKSNNNLKPSNVWQEYETHIG